MARLLLHADSAGILQTLVTMTTSSTNAHSFFSLKKINKDKGLWVCVCVVSVCVLLISKQPRGNCNMIILQPVYELNNDNKTKNV